MIDLKELRTRDIGRWVIYTNGHGGEEKGRIKSWNESGIFIVYGEPAYAPWDDWMGYTAAHTRPEDLEFV